MKKACPNSRKVPNWAAYVPAEMARAFTAIFKPLGFHYITLDLEGYRQGSLNANVGQDGILRGG